MPFAPVHLLFINLLTDSLPAIALGLEPDRSEVMSEKPRLADESILTKDFLSKIGLEGLVIGAMTMISFLTGYNQNGTLLGSTYKTSNENGCGRVCGGGNCVILYCAE